MKQKASRLIILAAGIICLAAIGVAQIQPPRPSGLNFFSPQQDVQLGREAAAQVKEKYPVVHQPDVEGYLTDLGKKLAHSQYAGDYPFTFSLIADKAINAFSLPGGPVFVNTGLFAAADNEAQLAGVLGHEMSHVVLRHGTNQVSKQNLIQLPVMLAEEMTGSSMLGRLAQIGIGVGANSLLLKFSRTDEAQADYNGALIAYDAGYNPVEMARFFEKLEAQGGREGALTEFLSDHPNPGNRVTAVQEEVRQLPAKQFVADSGRFQRIKSVVAGIPIPSAPAAPK